MKNILVIIMMLTVAVSAANAEDLPAVNKVLKKPIGLLRDGFAFPNSGIEGLVTKSRLGNKWFFSPYSDITDLRFSVLTGWPMEILPSSTLEKIVGEMNSEANRSSTLQIKLWAKVTKYSNKSASKKNFYSDKLAEGEVFTRNYIFPLNYISIKSTKKSATDTLAEPPLDTIEDQEPDDPTSIIPKEARDISRRPEKKSEKIVLDKSNTGSIIPKNVMRKFKPKHVENLSKWKKKTVVEKDISLTNRTGFITQRDGYKIFNVDAMGMAVDDATFKLLECETLQRTEEIIVTSPGRNRYKISGTVTRFNGEYYILLQRTVKTYNNGNFAR